MLGSREWTAGAVGPFWLRQVGFNLRASLGGKGIRTPDIQLAKLALYQLSYAPVGVRPVGARSAELADWPISLGPFGDAEQCVPSV